LLEVKNIFVSYGQLEVLHGIDLDVQKGEIVCVLGHNASGKTTLINAVLGLVRIRAGEIFFQGERIDKLPTNKIMHRGFAMVPENGQVFTSLTVLENLKMGFYWKPPEDFPPKLQQIFDLYPILQERQHAMAGLLSGGERQMLAVARAIISSPNMLIMDSPSMGLAPKYVKQQFETIRNLNTNLGVTVLVIEQNANMALTLSNRGYVLQNGLIALSGDAKELRNSEEMKRAYLA
jgi:branched-chain amino acid transport system ATP-binding protein